MKKQKSFDSMLARFKEIDQFSETVQFTFDGGKTKFKSYIGAIITLAMTITFLSFSFARMILMLKLSNSTVTRSVSTDYFSNDFNFNNTAYDFPIAFGINSFFNDITEDISDYGKLQAMYWHWGANGEQEQRLLKTR